MLCLLVGLAACSGNNSTGVGDETENWKGDETDWKTYKNEKYGFEFQYPDINTRFKTVGGWTDSNEPKITSRTPFNYGECETAWEGPGTKGTKVTIVIRKYCLLTVFSVEPNVFSTQYEYVSHIGDEDVGIVFEAMWGVMEDGQQVNQKAEELFGQIISTFVFIR